MALVIDTGPLFAFLNRSDSYHKSCVHLLETFPERLLIPSPVIVEVDQLAMNRNQSGSFLALLQDIIVGRFTIEHPMLEDYLRIRELCTRYADSDIGFVDASVLAIVERLNEPKLATLDHRHFGMMRPRHVPALRLLPE